MAGRARFQALRDELEKRTAACFDIDPVDVAIGNQSVPSHLEYVSAWIENGKTIKALCQSITRSLKIDVSYESLMRYLRERFGEKETEDALSVARVRASHSLAEDALRIVDAQASTQQQVSRAASRARSRQWMAERWNAQQYGQAKQTNVSISVTSLHLQALQAPTPQVTSGAPIAVRPSPDTRALPSQPQQ